jgi:prevent-host-death family protein
MPSRAIDLSGLYAYDMPEGVKRVTIGVQEARTGLRDLIDAALLEGQRTVIERHGKPVAVLVSVRDAQALFALDERPEQRAEIDSAAKPITPSGESD